MIKKDLIKDFLSKDMPSGNCKENRSALHQPKVSIVMPSYNQARFIESSIRSVLNQDYNNIQLIIIDGGSTDGTIDVIKQYSSLIDYWVSEQDKGQSDALNNGFSVADGEIYGWLNSDDLYMPGAIAKAVAALSSNPEKKIVFGDWLSVDEHDRIIEYNYAFDFNVRHFIYEGFHLNAQASFWRRAVHKKWNGFRLDLYNTMDYQMLLEFGLNQGNSAFLRIPVALGCFRRYPGQKTGSGDLRRITKEHSLMADIYGYKDKFSLMGKMKRVWYRGRRVLWLFRRGGISVIAKKVSRKIASAVSS